MNRNFCIVRSIVFAIGFVASLAEVRATPLAREYSWGFEKGNLVANWSFEGEAQGWVSKRNDPSISAFWVRVQALVGTPTGQFCAWASGANLGGGTADWITTTPIKVQPGTVSLSVKYKGTGNGDVRPIIIAKTYSGETRLQSAAAYATSPGWTRFVWSSITLPAGTQSIELVLAQSKGVNNAFDLLFDDVLLLYHTDTQRDVVEQESKITEDVAFVDGSGKIPVSFQKLEESSGEGYLVQAQTFDAYGRPSRSYRPFVRFGNPYSFTADNSGDDPGGVLAQEISSRATGADAFRDPTSGGSSPYTSYRYADADPALKAAGALTQVWAPGAPYQSMDANGLSGGYYVPDTSMLKLSPTISAVPTTAYPDAPLEFRWSKSPEGSWSLVWTNALGQTLKRSTLATTPPAGTDLRLASWIHSAFEYTTQRNLAKTFTDATLRSANRNDFQELQQVDARGRVIATFDPVRGLVRTWYDYLGRARLSQTSLQRSQSKAWYAEYDLQDRLVEEGVLTYTTGANLQAIADLATLSGGGISAKVPYKGFIYDTLTVSAFATLTGSGVLPTAPLNTWGRLVCEYNRNPEASIQGWDASRKIVADIYSYDAKGRTTTSMRYNPASSTQAWSFKSTTYASSGDVEKVVVKPSWTAPVVSQAYSFQYDRYGRVRTVKAAVGNVSQTPLARYDFNDFGDAISAEMAKVGQVGSFLAAGGEEYTYHQHGMMSSLSGRAGLGQQATFQELGYDRQAGSVATSTISSAATAKARKDGTISSIYTNYGKTSSLLGRSSSELETFQYDAAGRMTKSSAFLFPGTWKADQSASVSAQTLVPWSSATVEMSHDNIGRISSQKNGIGGVDQTSATYTYNPGTYTLYSVSGELRPGSTRNLAYATGVSNPLTWDADGQLTYDRSRKLGIRWGLDGMPTAMSVNSSPAYTDAAYQVLLYDAAGDLAARIRGHNVSNPGGTSNTLLEAKIYDKVGGRSFGEILESYPTDGVGEVVAKRIDYLHGASGVVGRVAPVRTETYTEYFLKDYQGSTLRTIRGDGALSYDEATVMDYHPFGQQLAMRENGAYPLGPTWTGKEFETLNGLYYFGARWYDPELGVWISPDPANQFHNPYAYASNPVMYTDPDGRFLFLALFALGAATSIYSNWGTIATPGGGVDWGAMLVHGTLGGLGGTAGPAGQFMSMMASNMYNGASVQSAFMTSSVNMAVGGLAGAAGGALAGKLVGKMGGGVLKQIAGGVAGGAISGAIGSTVGGTAIGMMRGQSFSDALADGAGGALTGALTGGVTGGVTAGVIAAHNYATNPKSQLERSAAKSDKMEAKAKAMDAEMRSSENAGMAQCFPAGTIVWMSNTRKSIESVKVGDTVLAFDPINLETKRSIVDRLYVRMTDSLTTIWTQGHKIVATPNHPFWAGEIGWTAARSLVAGMSLWSAAEARDVLIDSVSTQESASHVFNFEVRDQQTYLVGELGIGVHNCTWTKKEINGRNVYQRDDLVLGHEYSDGNMARMAKGNAPLGPDGKAVNLHHMLQTHDGPIAEVSQTFHQKNSSVIHINPSSTPSGIDRATFATFRKTYWIDRHDAIVNTWPSRD